MRKAHKPEMNYHNALPQCKCDADPLFLVRFFFRNIIMESLSLSCLLNYPNANTEITEMFSLIPFLRITFEQWLHDI